MFPSEWCLSIALLSCVALTSGIKYDPTWASIDSRPLPAWYDEAKLGVFMHWGVFSVPSYDTGAWLWNDWINDKNKHVIAFMEKNYKPGFTYADFARDFTADLFDAKTYAEIIAAAGAKYFVVTSKHHEGYTMWPSKTSFNWNSMDVGPKRDLIGELQQAFEELNKTKFGIYLSQYEWFHPLYLEDKANNFTTHKYVEQVVHPQVKELFSNYRPHVLWSDGDWEASSTYWRSPEILAWLYNESPMKDSVVTNDRWGNDSDKGRHGGYYSFGDKTDPGVLISHKWECCMTLDHQAWSHRRTMQSTQVMGDHEIVTLLARTVSCNGNLLINVGPTAAGTIPPIFEERLRTLGSWLDVNGEAIYGTRPWIYQNDTFNGHVWYTSRNANDVHDDRPYNRQHKYDTTVYAIVLKWPCNGKLVLQAPKWTKKVQMTPN